jgi:translation initiation factor IF-1
MPVEDSVKMTGEVIEVLPSLFKVRVNEDCTVLAHLSGKMRKARIKVILGDTVSVEMSPYDLSKGRISYRH